MGQWRVGEGWEKHGPGVFQEGFLEKAAPGPGSDARGRVGIPGKEGCMPRPHLEAGVTGPLGAPQGHSPPNPRNRSPGTDPLGTLKFAGQAFLFGIKYFLYPPKGSRVWPHLVNLGGDCPLLRGSVSSPVS